jgi:hypothetical protein
MQRDAYCSFAYPALACQDGDVGVGVFPEREEVLERDDSSPGAEIAYRFVALPAKMFPHYRERMRWAYDRRQGVASCWSILGKPSLSLLPAFLVPSGEFYRLSKRLSRGCPAPAVNIATRPST